MSRTKIFLHNVATAALLQIITMIAGFVLPRVMLDAYGSEINGLVVSLSQFIACFNLVEAGITASATYALYEPIARRDAKTINGILVAARNFYRKTGYLFTLLAVGLAIIYPVFVSTASLTSLETEILVLVLGVNGALEFFTLARYRVLLTADQKTYVISLASIAAIFCNVACFVGMAWAGFSVVYAKLVSVLSVFLRTWLLWYYCRKHYDYLDFNEDPVDSALERRWDAFYLQILGLVHNGVPIILATMLTDLKTVSVFAIYNLVAAGLQGLLGIFSNGLYASFGDIIARKELDTLQRAESEFEYSYYLLCGGIYGSAILLIVPFVVLYTHGVQDADYRQPVLGFMLMMNGLLYNFKTPQGMLVISAGLYRETRWQTTIQGGIELFGGWLFGAFWGLEGILWGMILSNLYRDIDLPFFICRHVTKLSPWKSFRRMGYAILVIGILLSTSLFVDIEPHNFGMWIVDAIYVSFGALIVSSMIGFLFEPETGRRLFTRF